MVQSPWDVQENVCVKIKDWGYFRLQIKLWKCLLIIEKNNNKLVIFKLYDELSLVYLYQLT